MSRFRLSAEMGSSASLIYYLVLSLCLAGDQIVVSGHYGFPTLHFKPLIILGSISTNLRLMPDIRLGLRQASANSPGTLTDSLAMVALGLSHGTHNFFHYLSSLCDQVLGFSMSSGLARLFWHRDGRSHLINEEELAINQEPNLKPT